MRALLVHNDNAGTNPEPREAIEAVLHEADIKSVYCAHGDEDLAAALRTPVDFIIAAGGDGTVADVVSALEEVGNRYEDVGAKVSAATHGSWRMVRPSGTEAPGARMCGQVDVFDELRARVSS